VPDKLLAQEVSYQTVEKGITTYLSEKNKKYWPNFPLHIGRYTLSNKPHAEKEVEALQEICLCTGKLKGHDPHNIVYDHIKSVKLTHPVIHEVNFVEDLFKGFSFLKKYCRGYKMSQLEKIFKRKKMKKGTQ
jgi:hypothetical protein